MDKLTSINKTNEPRKKAHRMAWGDYVVILFQQSRLGIGLRAPVDFADLCDGIAMECYTKEDFRSCVELADELFGKWPYNRAGERLFRVRTLTAKEGAIAARLDLTHSEKIELIRPLRAERKAVSDACRARKKMERRKREAAELEVRAQAAFATALSISTADRVWASQFGLSLS
jgi:hypothetical protein